MSETRGEGDASGRAEAESPRRHVDTGCEVGWRRGRIPDVSAPRGEAEKQAQRRDGGDCSEIPRLAAASLGRRCHPVEAPLGGLPSASPTASWQQVRAGSHAAHGGASRYTHLFSGGGRSRQPSEGAGM